MRLSSIIQQNFQGLGNVFKSIKAKGRSPLPVAMAISHSFRVSGPGNPRTYLHHEGSWGGGLLR